MPSEPVDPRLVRLVECLLFAAGRPLTVDDLADAAGDEPADVAQALEALDVVLAERGVQVVRVAGGYRLVTRPEYADAVRRLLTPPPSRLTPARLETLAVIAYRQPATRAEVEAVRGVDCQGTIRALLEVGLIEPRGRRHDRPGRPLLYATTRRFLDEFGLPSIEDLPDIEDLEA